MVHDDEYEILDYEDTFQKLSQQFQKEIRISEKKRLQYHPNGNLFTSCSYDDDLIFHQIPVKDFDSLVFKKTNFLGLSKDKVQDVEDLCKYIKPENKELILNYMSKIGIKK